MKSKEAVPLRILIDADGCPVVEETLACARRHGTEVWLVSDDAHCWDRLGVPVITVARGADSADYALVNRTRPGDLVVTQDYGLAAMCLARRAQVLHPNGFLYHEGNMDALLMARHTARKIRNAGGRLKGPKKRGSAQDAAFVKALEALLRAQAPE